MRSCWWGGIGQPEQPYIIVDRAGDYVGYSRVTNFGSLQGTLVPDTLGDSVIKALVQDHWNNRITVIVQPDIEGEYYFIRKDNFKGFIAALKLQYLNYVWAKREFFTKNDKGRTVELYISPTPPIQLVRCGGRGRSFRRNGRQQLIATFTGRWHNA